MVFDETSRLSFVIPVYNEEKTIEILCEKIFSVMESIGNSAYEVIFVDDGSRDDSWFLINQLVASSNGRVIGIHLRRNFGKSAALASGFSHAVGDVIFTLDADLQDDPAEIPNFLKALDEGFDLVSGWRKRRNDPVSKTLPSRLYNLTTAWVTGIRLHDFNCGFKAYRRPVLESISVYGELHRYIPVLANNLGFRVGEVIVSHNPREYGVSKYGWGRYAKGFIDLLTVLMITRYFYKPAHFFGIAGLLVGFSGFLVLLYLTFLWFYEVRPIGTRPLFFLGILLILLSVQLISLGILSELIVRRTEENKVHLLIDKYSKF